MVYQSETDLLVRRLDAIRAEKATLLKRVDELSADEQRINLALDVIRSVVADFAPASTSKREVALSAVATVGASASATLTVGQAQGGSENQRQRPRQSLESLILEAFAERDGMTSVEVAGMLELVSDAKKDSILSTLSRMAGKGLVRREGKLYFLVKKGESPEAATSGLSIATASGEGQPTTGATAGEEGDDL